MYLCVCMHLKLERSKPSLLHINAQETDEKELRNKTDEHKKNPKCKLCPRGRQTCAPQLREMSRSRNTRDRGKVTLDTQPESHQKQNLTTSRRSPLEHACRVWSTSISAFASYRQTDGHTDTHTRLITIACMLRIYTLKRAAKKRMHYITPSADNWKTGTISRTPDPNRPTRRGPGPH